MSEIQSYAGEWRGLGAHPPQRDVFEAVIARRSESRVDVGVGFKMGGSWQIRDVPRTSTTIEPTSMPRGSRLSPYHHPIDLTSFDRAKSRGCWMPDTLEQMCLQRKRRRATPQREDGRGWERAIGR